jgi:hypothetical protein
MADPSAFRDDDGSADPQLRDALTSGRIELDALADARLLLVLLPDAQEMSLVFMVNADGRRGLLAFTGIDSLHLWQADARPMPVPAHEAAQIAIDEGAALVIDVLGPARTVIDGSALELLAGPTSRSVGDR